MKKKGCQLAAFFLCMAIISGCGHTSIGEKQAFNPNITVGESEEKKTSQRVEALKIPCNFSEISSTPWRTTDQDNQSVIPLLFDPLIRLSPSFQPENALAEQITQAEKTYTITVRQGVAFTDGSLLTARDVDNCITYAMGEGSRYQQSLSNISSHRVLNDTQVEIVLREADGNFPALLTFPIAKLSQSRYIGTGRYRFRSDEGDHVALERNGAYWGELSSIPEIDLVELPVQEIASYSLKVGNVDCVYAGLSSDDSMNLSTSSYSVSCNNLVFLGANCLRGQMADQNLRKAVSLALDRDYLTQAIYSSRAKPAYTPYHPNYFRLEELEPMTHKRDLEQAKTILNDSGKLPESGTIALTLAYHSDNSSHVQLANQIGAQLGEAGFAVELIGRPYASYLALLESGGYDLYIGELGIPNNMDLSHLMTRGERYGYGTAAFGDLTQAWQAVKTAPGKESCQAFLNAYDQFLPAIPVLYREGIFAFSRSFSLAVSATATDLFYNIDQWQ